MKTIVTLSEAELIEVIKAVFGQNAMEATAVTLMSGETPVTITECRVTCDDIKLSVRCTPEDKSQLSSAESRYEVFRQRTQIAREQLDRDIDAIEEAVDATAVLVQP